jgi:hypothetical protein
MKVVKIIDGYCLLLGYIVVLYIAVVALYKSDSEVVRSAFMFFTSPPFTHAEFLLILVFEFQPDDGRMRPKPVAPLLIYI